MKPMTAEEIDRAEVELAAAFLWRRAEKPDEDVTIAYAEIYGEVVYDEKDMP